jgi:hypothetical protein
MGGGFMGTNAIPLTKFTAASLTPVLVFWNEPSHPVRGFSLHVGTPCVLRVVVKILLPRAISEALAPVLAERDAGDNTRRRTFQFLFCHYMTCHVRPDACIARTPTNTRARTPPLVFRDTSIPARTSAEPNRWG